VISFCFRVWTIFCDEQMQTLDGNVRLRLLLHLPIIPGHRRHFKSLQNCSHRRMSPDWKCDSLSQQVCTQQVARHVRFAGSRKNDMPGRLDSDRRSEEGYPRPPSLLLRIFQPLPLAHIIFIHRGRPRWLPSNIFIILSCRCCPGEIYCIGSRLKIASTL